MPDSSRAYGLLGAIRSRRREPALALEALARAVELDPTNVWQRMSLALLQRQQGKPADAISTYEAVLELSPDNVETALGIVAVYVDGGDLEQASVAMDAAATRIGAEHPAIKEAQRRLTELRQGGGG
jgi:predicted Zn-dependent protease